MLTLTLLTALADDVFPGLGQPSAVRSPETRANLELYGGASTEGFLVSETRLAGLSAAVDPTDGLRLGATMRGYSWDECTPLGSCKGRRAGTDITAHVTAFVIDSSHTRLGLTAGAGNAFHAGLALWSETVDGRWAVDATWQPGVYADGRLHPSTLMPEAGLTYTPSGPHTARLGIAGSALNLTYRFLIGPVALEALAGAGYAEGAHGRLAASIGF